MALTKLPDPSYSPFGYWGFEETTSPSYWSNNNNNYLICATAFDLIHLNLDENKKEITTPYNQRQFVPDCHGQCLDIENGILYTIGGSYSCFGIFDLNKGNQQILPIKFNEIMTYPNCIFIPSPINQVHVFHHKDHYIYNKTRQQLTKIDDVKYNMLLYKMRNPRMVYIKAKQQLMMIGSENSKYIWYIDVNPNQQDYRWISYNGLTTPFTRFPNTKIITAGHYIIVFVTASNCIPNIGTSPPGIWCLDLIQKKWIEISCSEIDEYNKYPVWIIKDKDNFIHFMNLRRNEKYHVKISLYDIMPTEVIGPHREYNDSLVVGYVKENESKFILNVPFALKKLILYYLPLFD